jgi:hypothetical protein
MATRYRAVTRCSTRGHVLTSGELLTVVIDGCSPLRRGMLAVECEWGSYRTLHRKLLERLTEDEARNFVAVEIPENPRLNGYYHRARFSAARIEGNA